MTEREPMTLEELRTALLVLEHDCHVSALTLGKDGLRAMCIEAQKRLHKLFPAIDALTRATDADALEIAGDLIRSVPEAEQEALQALYDKRRKELTE